MIAAVLAAAALAVPGLDLQLRPPDLGAPRPAAFLAQDLARGDAAAGPAAHGWGGELAAGAGGALVGTAAAALLAGIALSNVPCDRSNSWEFFCSRDANGSAGAVAAFAAVGTEVLLVPLAISLGVKWAGGHREGNGWRAYGYALGSHALVLLAVGLLSESPLGLAVLAVGDLLLVPLAARAGWHHAPAAAPPAAAPPVLSFRF